MQPKVYLAGPISGLGYGEATDWRKTAKQYLNRGGISAFSPMRGKDFLKKEVSLDANCEYGELSPIATPKGIMTRDRYDATTCDVLLVNLLGATRVSIGTVMEIAWADGKRIPIVCAIEATGNVHEHAMIDQAIGYRTATLKEAINIAIAILSE